MALVDPRVQMWRMLDDYFCSNPTERISELLSPSLIEWPNLWSYWLSVSLVLMCLSGVTGIQPCTSCDSPTRLLLTRSVICALATAGCGSSSSTAHVECCTSATTLSETRCASQFPTGDVPFEASASRFAPPFGPRTGTCQPDGGGCTEGLPSLGQIKNPTCAFESRFEVTSPEEHPVTASFAHRDDATDGFII